MTDNDNSKNRSTANILDTLKEEVLSDANLSPDSPVRKKRDTERFNAMLVAAFIQYIKIINFICVHWKLQIEKAIEKFEMEKKFHRDILNSVKQFIIQKAKLSAKQFEKLHSLSAGFLNLFNILNERIKILDQKIETYNVRIESLKQARAKLHTALIEAWETQVLMIDIPVRVNIPLHLPAEYQYLDKREDIEKVVGINSNEIQIILAKVGENLKNHESVALELHNKFYEQILPFVINKLNLDWAFLPSHERELAINLKIKEPEFQHSLSDPIIKLLSQQSIIEDNIKSRYILDQDTAHLEAQRDLDSAYRDILMDKLDLIKSIESESEKLEESVSIQNLSDKNIDQILVTRSYDLEKLDESLTNDEEAYYQAKADIDATSINIDDLLSELNQISQDLSKPNELQLDLLEEKQIETVAKVDDFMQMIKNQDDNIEFVSKSPSTTAKI